MQTNCHSLSWSYCISSIMREMVVLLTSTSRKYSGLARSPAGCCRQCSWCKYRDAMPIALSAGKLPDAGLGSTTLFQSMPAKTFIDRCNGQRPGTNAPWQEMPWLCVSVITYLDPTVDFDFHLHRGMQLNNITADSRIQSWIVLHSCMCITFGPVLLLATCSQCQGQHVRMFCTAEISGKPPHFFLTWNITRRIYNLYDLTVLVTSDICGS